MVGDFGFSVAATIYDISGLKDYISIDTNPIEFRDQVTGQMSLFIDGVAAAAAEAAFGSGVDEDGVLKTLEAEVEFSVTDLSTEEVSIFVELISLEPIDVGKDDEKE